jgi:hypothetical protein
MNIDFGNGTTSGKLAELNDQGEQASTTYATGGRYHVRGIGVEEHTFQAGGWNCQYRCCRYDDSFIDIK